MAVAAIDSQPPSMVLMTERHRLRADDSRICHIRRALQIHAQPKHESSGKNPRINRGASNYVSAAMENLHRSGFFCSAVYVLRPETKRKSVQLCFLKLAIIAV